MVDSGAERVDPETNVVQRRLVNFRGARWVDGLHEVELDCQGPVAKLQDVLVNILGGAAVVSELWDTKEAVPEPREPRLAQPAKRNLLQPKDPEWTRRHGASR